MHVLYGSIIHDEGPTEVIVPRAAQLLYDVTLGARNYDIVVAHEVEDVRRYTAFKRGGLVYTVNNAPSATRGIIAVTNELIYERDKSRIATSGEGLWRDFNEAVARLRRFGIEITVEQLSRH